jgi:hypothetical protein
VLGNSNGSADSKKGLYLDLTEGCGKLRNEESYNLCCSLHIRPIRVIKLKREICSTNMRHGKYIQSFIRIVGWKETSLENKR